MNMEVAGKLEIMERMHAWENVPWEIYVEVGGADE
jgi:hypothetical protein